MATSSGTNGNRQRQRRQQAAATMAKGSGTNGNKQRQRATTPRGAVLLEITNSLKI